MSIVDKIFENTRKPIAAELFSSAWCNLDCSYCLTDDTLILTSDLIWKSIKKIKIGDIVIGALHQNGDGPHKYWKFDETKVTNIMNKKDVVYKVTTSDGESIKATGYHPFLSNRKDYPWVIIDKQKNDGFCKMKQGMAIKKPFSFTREYSYDSDDYKVGYLNGVYDGDGCHIDKHYTSDKPNKFGKYQTTSRFLSISLTDIEILDRIEEYLYDLDIRHGDRVLRGTNKNTNKSYYGFYVTRKSDIEKILYNYSNTDDFKRGYLAGMFDAEGSFDGKRSSVLRISNYNKGILNILKDYLTYFNIEWVEENTGIRLINGLNNTVKFLSTTNPVLKRKKDISNYQIISKKITSIEKLGLEDVYNFETENETYIANGFVVHNCYIPKHNDMIKNKHKEIIEEIKQVDPVIDRLWKFYGENLELMSHWGSEPTLTIQYFNDFYKKAVEVFPNLSSVNMSSNFINNTDKLVEFIKIFPKENFNFTIQISLDGPPCYTDVNRRQGNTKKIVENVCYFFREINKLDISHKITTHFKSTLSKDQFKTLEHYGNVKYYYDFFNDTIDEIEKNNPNKKIFLGYSVHPSLVCPDRYTKEDGISFHKAIMTKKEVAKNETFKYAAPFCSYYNDFKKLFYLQEEVFTKSHMFSCSAGDSQFGISEFLHPCHDTFYLPYKEFENALANDTDRILNEKNNIENGRYELSRRTSLLKFDDSEDILNKYILRYRGYHDFFNFKSSLSYAYVKELAYAGQISECYKKDEMAGLLSMFCNSRNGCPTGSLMYNGSMHITHPGYFKLFGNGTLEQFVKDFFEENV